MTLSGAGTQLLVRPGVQTVNGDLTINGSDTAVVISFNRKRLNGTLEVNGQITFGPDNPPSLVLDLANARFSKGDSFEIIRSDRDIAGKFLNTESTLSSSGYTLQISYTVNIVRATVTDIDKDRIIRRTTPVIELDTSLIDPTSTAPGQW